MTWYHRYAERVVQRSEPDEDCWIWQGALSADGYGVMRTRLGPQAFEYVHRVIFMHEVRELEEGETIDHVCKERACVNPEHLRAMSHEDNCVAELNRKELDLEEGEEIL